MTPAEFVRAALLRVGAPYIWCGKGPVKWTADKGLVTHGLGVDVFDCSGLVTCALRAAGGPDWRGSHNARSLFEQLTECPRRDFFGCLLFYGPTHAKPSHVAISLGNELILEAGGGDRTTTTLAWAARVGAKVRVCFDTRQDCLGARFLPSIPLAAS